jgi:hypothetical protein
MKLRIATFLALAGLIAFAPKPARADGLSYNFGGCTDAPGSVCSGDVGSTVAKYTSGGFTVIAQSFSGLHNYDLYIKTAGGDEHGLGMAGTADHEILPGEFIQLDISSLVKAGFTHSALILGSVQLGEGYRICVTSVFGVDGGSCFTGHLDGLPVNVNFGSGKYIDVTATTGDILLADGLVVTPEPTSLMLLGTGLLLVCFAVRKTKAVA